MSDPRKVSDIVDWLRGLSDRQRTAFGSGALDGCRYDEAADEIIHLRAALAEAEGRIKHMSGVLLDAESLLGVEETGELILRPIERLQADLAEAERERNLLRAQLACRADTDQCVMDEEPEIPCDEKNCRYVQIVSRAERAEADLAGFINQRDADLAAAREVIERIFGDANQTGGDGE